MSYTIKATQNGDGSVTLKYHGDAQGLVDHCADYARSYREGERKQNGWGIGARKVLSIDPIVAMEVARQRGMDYFNPDLWKEFMHRDYSKFRCIDDKRMFTRRGATIIQV